MFTIFENGFHPTCFSKKQWRAEIINFLLQKLRMRLSLRPFFRVYLVKFTQNVKMFPIKPGETRLRSLCQHLFTLITE
jgi:hypothetical protein